MEPGDHHPDGDWLHACLAARPDRSRLHSLGRSDSGVQGQCARLRPQQTAMAGAAAATARAACTAPRAATRAFDEYRQRELRRLEEERRRLDEERREFETYVQNLRRAKDQEEFDRFMADRNAPQDQRRGLVQLSPSECFQLRPRATRTVSNRTDGGPDRPAFFRSTGQARPVAPSFRGRRCEIARAPWLS